MINVEEYDNRLRQELGWQYIEKIKPIPGSKEQTRLKLFWDYRYANGSYKAIKAGIKPSSVFMRFGNDKFRLYGQPENNKLFDDAKKVLAGWKARSKAEIRAYKAYVKANKRDYVGFNDWLKLREVKV